MKARPCRRPVWKLLINVLRTDAIHFFEIGGNLHGNRSNHSLFSSPHPRWKNFLFELSFICFKIVRLLFSFDVAVFVFFSFFVFSSPLVSNSEMKFADTRPEANEQVRGVTHFTVSQILYFQQLLLKMIFRRDCCFFFSFKFTQCVVILLNLVAHQAWI